jgi:UDP-glucose 4-epimerase
MAKDSKGCILVTGGTGYIGSHTAVELMAEGYEVVIADNLSNSSPEVLTNIEKIAGKKPVFHQVELCDEAATKALFAQHPDITAVIHFAALKAVGESVEKPLHYYRNNIFSLVHLLECMKEAQVPSLVFSSSCTVYGQPDHLPVAENAPFKSAASPYGQTKQMGEQILEDSVKAQKLNVISLRYFNPIGAHDSSLIGELPIGVPNNLVPMITQTAVGIREKLLVFGNDYDTKDGSCIRDYIHVVDIAKAHVKAINRLVEGHNKKNLEIFNLGTGNGFTVLETIQSFEKVSGKKLNYQITGRRSGDVEKVYANTSFANEELGWKAERNLDNMLLTAWNWQLALEKKK